MILGAEVYTPTAFSIYPVSRASNSQLLSQPSEGYLLSLLKAHLRDAEGKMFFSYSSAWDATSSLQRQGSDAPLWKRADDSFFWNKHLQSRLIDFCQKGENQAVSTSFLVHASWRSIRTDRSAVRSSSRLHTDVSKLVLCGNAADVEAHEPRRQSSR